MKESPNGNTKGKSNRKSLRENLGQIPEGILNELSQRKFSRTILQQSLNKQIITAMQHLNDNPEEDSQIQSSNKFLKEILRGNPKANS